MISQHISASYFFLNWGILKELRMGNELSGPQVPDIPSVRAWDSGSRAASVLTWPPCPRCGPARPADPVLRAGPGLTLDMPNCQMSQMQIICQLFLILISKKSRAWLSKNSIFYINNIVAPIPTDVKKIKYLLIEHFSVMRCHQMIWWWYEWPMELFW